MDFSKVTSPTRKQFVNNLKDKLQDKVFIGDTASLLSPGENYDAQEAFNVVNETLLEKL